MRVRFSLPAQIFNIQRPSRSTTVPKNKPKIIVIVGPTATGKSALAVKLARSKGIQGEVISADSRQIYKGLDIGSGKITPKEMKDVPHHMLDVAPPKKVFTVAEFQEMGQRIVIDILSRGKTPIICGGSGFYIDALVDSTEFPDVLPNPKLRSRLEKKSVAELCKILRKIDSRRFKEIDQNNPRRLVRAIEIATALGKVPAIKKAGQKYSPLFIGIDLPDEILQKKIHKRLIDRIHGGMIVEVKNLHKNGLSWKRLKSFGLEYRAVAEFLQKKIGRHELVSNLEQDIWKFVKRQRVWFKRNKKIEWFKPQDFEKIKSLVNQFLK